MFTKRLRKKPRSANFVEDADIIPDPTSFQKPEGWWIHPPKDMEGMLRVLELRAHHLRDATEEGEALRSLLKIVDTAYYATESEIKAQYPIAYFKPSYEQSLLLNSWIWGIDFVICFSANRIGKTVALVVINPCLWILPNNPEWEMFAARLQPNPDDCGATFIENPNQESRFYLDIFDRPVQLLIRPPIQQLELIKQTLKDYPHLLGDPSKSHLESENAEKFASLQEMVPEAFSAAWPAPSIEESGTIWLGAPDNEFHETIILPEWKRWLPRSAIISWSDNDLSFKITTKDITNPCPTEQTILCKSYESEDTKWSGSAVLGIVLTEGLTPNILNEVKQRIKANGFGSWDYTPYEARNVGSKTALAFKVWKGEEQLPLRAHIFTRFSIRQAPAYILPTSKRDDLIRMWEGKKEGDARLDGIFYSSSPLILAHLDRTFHCLNWSLEELKEKYPNGQHYRGLDPGYDHPTVCCWGYLVPGNIWFIYRYYVERGKTIRERCSDIVKLSHNELRKKKLSHSHSILSEIHPHPSSEPILLTATDYHIFKDDETSGQPYYLNYLQAGLVVTESTHMAPKDRALDMDNKLAKSEYHQHPTTRRTPGARIFFLINGQGVDQALGKMESLFWERLASGPNRGEAKDEVPTHKDDELDATCYLVCGPYVWTNFQPKRINNWVDEEDLQLQACKNEIS